MTHPVLGFEEALLLPPGVPGSFHVLRRVSIREFTRQVLLLAGFGVAGVDSGLLHFLGFLGLEGEDELLGNCVIKDVDLPEPSRPSVRSSARPSSYSSPPTWQA